MASVAPKSGDSPVADVTIDDTVGCWCGEHSNYTFSRTEMVVTPLGNWELTHAPHWVIDKVETDGNQIEVFWKPAKPDISTAFELRDDGDVTIDDIVGRWCGERTNYTFSRTDMVVTPRGNVKLTHAPHWVIDKVEANGNHIQVFWRPAKPGNSTGFELSGNKRTLIQQPETAGDKGPRRVFHRC